MAINALSKPVHITGAVCSLSSFTRLSTLCLYRRVIYLGHWIFMFVLCSVYLVEYTFYPNSIIEILPEL